MRTATFEAMGKAAAAALVLLSMLMLAAPAQAQYYFECDFVKESIEFGYATDDELAFYEANCVGDEEPAVVEVVDTDPPMMTCTRLPDTVEVSGYAFYTACQMPGDIVISQYPDLQERGFIDAVDIWQYVNGGLDVCFRGHGWLVFLDAAYAPRMASELEHFHRDGMTCGKVDRVGTIVLLEEPPAADTAPEPVNTLPVFDAIPLDNCLIKLVDTLFLRATPAGKIIGLVWLNSEVPAFEIKGYWYKVEFEGQVGYISRYYRKVVRGGCG